MEKDLLVFNLNKALQLEFSDIFLYIREAGLIKDSSVRAVFEKFGLMEIMHADILGQHILALGGKPLWDYSLLLNQAELKSMIIHHMDYENRAIDFYGKLIEQVDDQTKILLRGIRDEEQEHFLKLKEILAQMA